MSHREIATSITHSTVISKDGTVIGYKSTGQGPGVIVLHGALSSSDDFTNFAQELADSFTVHVIDRRGRGMSGPQGNEYSIRKECEDLTVVQEATGAAFLFGHSFGGLVALETARMNNLFTKIALYEPGVSIEGSIPTTWLPNYEKALNKNDTYGAFAIFVRALGPVKSIKLIPIWYLKLILRIMLRKDHWKHKERLLPESMNEHKEIGLLDSTFSNYSSIYADTLLIAGGKSPESERNTMRVLDQTMPNTKTIVLPNLSHFAPDNQYSPAVVGQQVKQHFLS
ncbi:alpha/beta hydrolase [Paenibacillus sp. GP183]|uniref:alpha/beta fold hydrolase n=1 Tax=Paenibacillus sp. GP183 TaxID=1882751 RepID=UPI00089BBEA3|nr:alpha/beta hydrolase [Paenibacillus sp. GP183]SEB98734.1 Pimeloyl-ACP methyl ester carboxylesterase [Paenibacillus sp. GP183]